MVSDRIPAEILQKIPSSVAWEYMIVPFNGKNEFLECYGEKKRDYNSVKEELMVIYNLNIKIKPIDNDSLKKLLSQYYRQETGTTPTNSVSEITGGQNFLMGIIEEAFSIYSSDIHLETYEDKCRIRFRVDGKLIEKYVINKNNYPSLINQIKINANLDISEKRLPQDGRLLFKKEDKKFDVRVSCLPTIYGEKIVLRLLTRHIELLELNNLGFCEKQLKDYSASIEKPNGMVLICGPTGSGKSTTLYATLRRLNKESSNILTIEDPVEYTMEGVNQVQLKEEIGLTFTSALRTFLRQDPDIIMLGEIRDSDTAQMAIRSSLTGHLIFSTIHTNSAWGCIARLIDMGVHPYLITYTLNVCVAQRLIRLVCPHCKEKVKTSTDFSGIPIGKGMKYYYTAKGCPKCYYTGYSGRRAIYEVIPMDEELAEAARRNEPNIDDLLKSRNIKTLTESALELLFRGETTYEEIISIVKN